MSKITPHNLWLAHRTAAGGKSTVTGAPLPETIEDCAAGPQETHYSMAVFIATVHGDPDMVPVPPRVTPERAAALKVEAQRIGRSVAGLGGVFAELVGKAS